MEQLDGRRVGRVQIVEHHQRNLAALRQALANTLGLEEHGGKRLDEVARRPEVGGEALARMLEHRRPGIISAHPEWARSMFDRAITDIRYECYMPRQRGELRRARESEHAEIPSDLNVRAIAGICSEAVEVLTRMRPATLGQASRLAGVSPADISILEVTLRRRRVLGRT